MTTRGHIVECPVCGHSSRAETLLVARQKDFAHREGCSELVARAKRIAEATAAQGDLFGDDE